MIKKNHIIRIGCIFVLGLFIQVTTSSLFEWATGIYRHGKTPYYDFVYRDFIVMMGQDAGELCYAICFFILFKKGGVYIFRPVVDFFISLILIDMLHIIFFNPYEMPLSKFIAFGLSFLYAILKVVTYLKKNERTVN